MGRVSDPALRAQWLRAETAVIGLARSGRGVPVYASDAGDTVALHTTAAELRADGIAVDVGRHDLERIARSSLVVTSPGVPPDAPPIVAARRAGVDVVSEVEIALRFLPRL